MADWRTTPSSAGAAIARVSRALRDAGLPDAGLDGRLLVGAALGLSQAELLRAPERRLTALEEERLSGLLARRLDREPVSRILGRRAFFGREFAITPATLDPRPESETLVEAALDFIRSGHRDTGRPLRILDVGTGSGCLLVTLLAEVPHAVGVGTDIDPLTLEAASENAQRHGVAGRARFLLESSLEELAEGPFDVLVSNPPYIRTTDLVGLAPEVVRFDPPAALDGGPDGLAFYRHIARNLPRLVAPEGAAFLEVGAGQAEAVSALLAGVRTASHSADLWAIRDLDGRQRCVAWKARHTRLPTGADA